MKQQRTILIVDRFPIDRQTYQQYLSQFREVDYKVLHADSGNSALEICQNSSLHAVLLSSDLPDLTCLEFLTKLGSSYRS